METWKVVTISLTGVSLLWNVANTFYTRHSNVKNTKRLVILEEFRARVRDPLEDVLRRTEGEIRDAVQLAQHPDFPVFLDDSLIDKNRTIVCCMSEVQDRLIDADKSQFAADIDWLDMYDPAEDEILELMNDYLDDTKSTAERTDAVRHCKVSFRKFKAAITAKIESHVVNLSA